MISWISSFFALLFPRSCVICNGPLHTGDDSICLQCNIGLPRTNYHLWKDNPVEKLLWGRIPLTRATAFFFYSRGSDFKNVLYPLKYKGDQELGEYMGRFIATELYPHGFFDGIDIIVPIPLHKKKFKKRGYNQSERIAKGITSITNIPVDTSSVIREINTETQTRKSTFDRWENVSGIFRLKDAANITGKHILIIDDVLTTGATTTSLCEVFQGVEGLRISVLALAVAQQ